MVLGKKKSASNPRKNIALYTEKNVVFTAERYSVFAEEAIQFTDSFSARFDDFQDDKELLIFACIPFVNFAYPHTSALGAAIAGNSSGTGILEVPIGDLLFLPEPLQLRLWQRFQDDRNVSRRHNTDRPRVTMLNEDQCLAVTPKTSSRSTASDLFCQLSAATGTTVSKQIVNRRLGHNGLYPGWALSRSRSTGGPPRFFGVTAFS
ncbi:HTH_Tnp_Tc3_2 domain-containing protein [Trichonephila clavipes]|nr:HTH_Tnp_Tc3_2 domain-containing protein [Trichonephila clavipes]